MLSVQWCSRKSSHPREREVPQTPSKSQKYHYPHLSGFSTRDRSDDSSDLLIAGYENYIQIISIQYSLPYYRSSLISRSSSSSVLYTINNPYKTFSSIDCKIALISDCFASTNTGAGGVTGGVTPSSFISAGNDYPSRSDGSRYLLSGHQHQRIQIDYSSTTVTASQTLKGAFDFLEPFAGKKKENDAGASGLAGEVQNVLIYDLNRMELIASFAHNRGSVIAVGTDNCIISKHISIELIFL